MMSNEKGIYFGEIKIDFSGWVLAFGTAGGIIFLATFFFGIIFDDPLTVYNFEASELTETQVYDYLEDKHEAWFCNLDQTLGRYWCFGGSSDQIRTLSIAERNVEIVEK